MPQSDEAALKHTQRATASLKRALDNLYSGDPVHELIDQALRSAERAEDYMIRLRDNL
jgi:hypothetical protein